jgi:hypothetical protein
MSAKDPNEFAKQLRTYADAITAFCIIQSVAFGFALGNKDFRDNVLKLKSCELYTLGTVAIFFYTFLVIGCQRGEEALLGKSKLNDPVEVWARRVRWARLLVIILAEIIMIVGVYFTFRGAPAPGPATSHIPAL